MQNGPTVRRASREAIPERAPQVSLFEVAAANPKLEELRRAVEQLDIYNLTPMQALTELEKLKKLAAS
jgi:hypothetical protein